MAYDETLASRVRKILSPVAGFSEKKMFGGLCFLIHGNMCCGVLKNELVLRADSGSARDLLRRPHTRPMDFTGRPLKGFVFIENGGLCTDRQLRDWLSLALSFAQSLPRKSSSKPASRGSTSRPAKPGPLREPRGEVRSTR
jgi:TfoX/Sxy family transcriptional regulator of competence genes